MLTLTVAWWHIKPTKKEAKRAGSVVGKNLK